ncbi:MAG: hypothetical protein ACRDE7_12970, partial [Sphingobacterium sp.]
HERLVFSRHKVLDKKYTQRAGDFFPNLHDLLPTLRTRTYLCSMKREQQAYSLLGVTKRGSNEDSIAEMVYQEFNVRPYSNR